MTSSSSHGRALNSQPSDSESISRSSVLSDYWAWQPQMLDSLRKVHEIVVEQAASASGVIGNALLQYTSRPGKMLRPALVIIGSWDGSSPAGNPPAGSSPRGNGDRRDHILQIAAAVEILHLSTLIHDDVVDDARMRRGEPALHTLYGRRQAVLMGDYLFSRCFSIISAGTTRENAERLASATGHMCRGELEQLEEMRNPTLSRRAYRRRIIQKTALLFTLSLVVGASEAGAKRPRVADLARVGYNLGMAFQIIDDLLDFTASPSTLGKPTASDLQSGLFTLPVIEAVAAHPEIREAVLTPPRNQDDLKHLIEQIRIAGGFERARAEAKLYTRRAERALGALPDRRQKLVLTELTQRLLDRRY